MRRGPTFTVTILALLISGPAAHAAEPATGIVEGTISYTADAERPWRYARFYVKNGRLAEAVVAIESDDTPAKPATKPTKHTVDQEDFRFVPETTVIRAGDSVTFTNSDPQVHNVFTGDLTPFNVNTPPDGEHTIRFPKAGGTETPVRIGCIYHSTMRAWIYVFDHPHFALTDEKGTFRITGLPAGKHVLTIAHPAGRLRRTVEVVVKDGETTKIEVSLSPDDLIKRKAVTIP